MSAWIRARSRAAELEAVADAALLAAWRAGWSQSELAAAAGITQQAIAKRLARLRAREENGSHDDHRG